MRIHILGAETFAGRHAVAALVDAHCEASALEGADAVIDCRELHNPLTRLRMRRQPDPRLGEAVVAMRRAGVRRVVLLSTALVFGPDHAGRRSEVSAAHPVHTYERLRAMDEAVLRGVRDLEVVVVRSAQPFGAGEPMAQAWLARLAAGRVRLVGGGRAPRTFIAGPDLGRVLVAAALRGRPGGIHLAGGFDSTWRDLFEAVAAASQVPLRILEVPYDLGYVQATWTELRTPFEGECWPSMFAVDLVGRPLLLDDALSRRELTWSPKVAGFSELPRLGEILKVPAAAGL